MAAAKGTPMMAQYQAIKEQNPDSLLFFRLGDFYELFGDDAKEASRLLGITLTARTSGQGRSVSVPMAGVPYHSASNYIQRLLRAGDAQLLLNGNLQNNAGGASRAGGRGYHSGDGRCTNFGPVR